MAKWNFGIVGAGMIAAFHAKAIGDIDNSDIVGFCDNGSGNAAKLADEYGGVAFEDYKSLIMSEDVNVVAIATPSGFHLEPALLAAEEGKHVICEKPLEVTSERVSKMIKAHDKAGTYLGGIFPYRYNESLQPLKSAIEDGRFGKITFAAIHVPWWRDHDYYKDSWHGTWALDGGGALMNQSIHMIDYLLYLMGPVKEIKSISDHLAHPQIEAEDTSVSVIRFENGALGMIYGTTGSYPGRFRRLEITGTNGTVIQEEDSFKVWQFREEQPADEIIRERFGNIHGGGGVSDPSAIPYENHTRNISAFLNAIEEERSFEINGDEAKKAVDLIERIYKASGIR